VRILVTGSRTWDLYGPVFIALSLFGPETVVVHGGAKGADSLAEDAAKQLGFQTEVHFAQWDKHGRRAGILRNEEMLDTSPDLVLAFWDGASRGTRHCIDSARIRGIPVQVIGP